MIDVRFKDQLAGFNPKYDSTGVIKLTAYKANHLTYTTKLQSNQLAVFSEIYYDKGWNAYIDGKPVPHLRANYVLRAMKIPAGNHTIEFKFEPKTYYTGEKIALAGSILVLLIFVGGVFMELRNSGSNDKRSVS
ncbi:MAG: YfhO family protein [Bacteroidetes bacterium]|nr:YfhO family protein [Bacteroidota bacterium]